MDLTAENKSAAGRPTVITAEIITKLLAALQRGLTVATACDLAEISERTFYDYQKVSAEFSQRVKAARAFGKSISSDIIMDVLLDHDPEKDPKTGQPKHKYTKDQRINTAKWWLEKQEPEMFGKVVVNQQNNQNNFYLLNNEQLSDFSKQPDIANSDPTELLKALEAAKDVESGTEERRIVDIHSPQIQDQNTAGQSVSQSPATV